MEPGCWKVAIQINGATRTKESHRASLICWSSWVSSFTGRDELKHKIIGFICFLGWLIFANLLHIFFSIGTTSTLLIDQIFREFLSSILGAFFALSIAKNYEQSSANLAAIFIKWFSYGFFLAIPVAGILAVELFKIPYSYDIFDQLSTVGFGIGGIISSRLLSK